MDGFDLGPLLEVQTRIAKLKSAYNSLEVWDDKPTCRKSWAWNILVRFDIGPPVQGQTRIAKHKSAYNSLIIDSRGLQCETNSYEILG